VATVKIENLGTTTYNGSRGGLWLSIPPNGVVELPADIAESMLADFPANGHGPWRFNAVKVGA
jgi:hypothetical protein